MDDPFSSVVYLLTSKREALKNNISCGYCAKPERR